MRRMIAASVARRIALKKTGAGTLALAVVPDANQRRAPAALQEGERKRRNSVRRG